MVLIMRTRDHTLLASIVITVTIYFITLSQQIFALSTGIIGHSGNPAVNDGNTCILCHTGGVAPEVILAGPDTVEAGTANTYTLSLSGGQENTAGFNVSVSNGLLSSSAAGIAVDNNELKHTQSFTAGTSGIEWSFSYEAPATEGAVTLYATALSGNGDSAMSGDNSSTASIDINVTPAQRLLPPTASIDAPSIAAPGASINFDASTSVDGDGSISRYLWDFGDGSAFEQGITVSHVFAVEGDYTVTMAATDNDGLTGVTSISINISSNPGSALGESLYNQHCFACHGSGGTGGLASAVTGATVDSINLAITNIVSMQSIILTAEESQLIADYLVSGGGGEPPPRPTDGPGLYGMFCSACHGADGRGGTDIGVTGAPFAMIEAGIAGVAVMQSIELSMEETQLIADYLTAGGGGTIPNDGEGLYEVFCSVCHGSGGHGGKFEAVTGSSSQMITEAITDIAWMQALSLNTAQIQSISTYLSAGGGGALPTDGAGLYGVFCGACHGDGGHGGKFIAVTGAPLPMLEEAIINIEWMQGLQMDAAQKLLVADYLSAGGEGPTPTDGKGLYDVFCGVCHGSEITGGKFFAVTGAPLDMINDGIANVEWMQSLQVNSIQRQTIADYLVAGGETPRPSSDVDTYNVYCSVCHGYNGIGRKYSAITGASEEMIAEAIANIPRMNLLPIDNTQVQQVSDYLVSGGGQTIPTDGAGLYELFCAVCHGDGGHGGKFLAVTGAPASMINNAVANRPWMDTLSMTSTQVNMIADFLVAGGSGPVPTDGPGLYQTFCSVCHGADGRGGIYKVVTGSALSFTTSALNNIGLMQPLNLTLTQRQTITDYLAAGGGGSKPTDGAGLYHVYCETCHGPNGRNGPEESVDGASTGEINREIIGTSEMRQLMPYLTTSGPGSDTSLISNFLNN